MRTTPPPVHQRAFAPVQTMVSVTIITFVLTTVAAGAVMSAQVLHRQVLAGSPSIHSVR